MVEKWKKLKTSNLVLSLIVCSNLNRSALVRDLLGNNSLFVGQLYKEKTTCGQLYKDKSLALCAHYLIFFTTDRQTVNYYSTNHSQNRSIS